MSDNENFLAILYTSGKITWEAEKTCKISFKNVQNGYFKDNEFDLEAPVHSCFAE